MASSRITQSLPPNIDPTKAQVAFGLGAFTKLKRELDGDDLLIKQQALMSLCDLLRSPQNISSSIKEGIVDSLNVLLSAQDTTVRLKSAEAVFHLSGHAIGRQVMIENNVIKTLSQQYNDKDAAVRRNTHAALNRITQTLPSGMEMFINAGLISTLVEKIKTEIPEIQDIALDVLHNCLRFNVSSSLDAGALPVLQELLAASNSSVKAKALRCIKDIGLDPKGRDAAVNGGHIAKIVSLLEDKDIKVRSEAAGAIMSLSITTAGKKAAVLSNAPMALCKLINDSDESVIVNTIKAITSITDNQQAREIFQSTLPRLKELCSYKGGKIDPDLIARNAKIAVERICWKP